MLDLVAEEEIISGIAGMAFDDLLCVLDEESPADLRDLYADTSDRYMILAGKGHRSNQEDLELDRLDSSLHMILGEKGILALSARLIRTIDAARSGAILFLSRKAPRASRVKTPFELDSAAAICRQGMEKSVIPVDGIRLSRLAHRAARSASSLLDIDADRSLLGSVFCGRQISDRSVARLLEALSTKEVNLRTYLQAMALLDPDRTTPRRRHQLVTSSFRLSGLLSCVAILAEAGAALKKAADLVREGLGS